MPEPLDTAGTPPLTAKTEPWMDRLMRNGAQCRELIEKYGSPINVHNFDPLAAHVAELADVARERNVQFGVYFARKANKTFGAVQAAYAAGAGIDVASRRELEQCLELGIPGDRIILTAATKTPATIDAALKALAVISVDNEDEFRLVHARATRLELEAQIALRLYVVGQGMLGRGEFGESVVSGGIAPSRFGLGAEHWIELVGRAGEVRGIKIRGVHFHLNGYSAQERAVGITEALELIDQLKGLGHQPEFVDMGGGIPVNYLTSGEQWRTFWQAVAEGRQRRGTANTGNPDHSMLATSCWGGPQIVPPEASQGTQPSDQLEGSQKPPDDELLAALASETDRLLNPPPTWRGDTLGLRDAHDARPSPNTYPYYQETSRGAWLAQVLDAPAGAPVAEELARRNLELRCEPGRALMDGCGMTIAQVASRQKTSDGIDLVVLYMNRTQMRSTSADFLVDPIHIRPPARDGRRTDERWTDQFAKVWDESIGVEPLEGAYLMGSYCIEEELILRRAFDFPQGAQVGDLIAFPNTAGYLMHILESASHQIPLAANLMFDAREEPAAGDDPQSDVAMVRWVQDGVDQVNPAGGEPLGSA